MLALRHRPKRPHWSTHVIDSSQMWLPSGGSIWCHPHLLAEAAQWTSQKPETGRQNCQLILLTTIGMNDEKNGSVTFQMCFHVRCRTTFSSCCKTQRTLGHEFRSTWSIYCQLWQQNNQIFATKANLAPLGAANIWGREHFQWWEGVTDQRSPEAWTTVCFNTTQQSKHSHKKHVKDIAHKVWAVLTPRKFLVWIRNIGLKIPSDVNT